MQQPPYVRLKVPFCSFNFVTDLVDRTLHLYFPSGNFYLHNIYLNDVYQQNEPKNRKWKAAQVDASCMAMGK